MRRGHDDEDPREDLVVVHVLAALIDGVGHVHYPGVVEQATILP